jgi:putative membrane protein
VAADYSWTLDPGPIALMALALVLYVQRWRHARAQGGARAAPGWRLACFVAGIAGVAVALVSPVDRLGEQAFSMHMVQHVLLLDLAPIALVCGLTKVILRPVTRRLQALEHAAGPLGHPLFAVCLYVAVMWVWHIPRLYDAALQHSGVHALEHTCFFWAGALYWWHLLSPIRSRKRLGGMGPVLYMASTKLFVGILGIAITFAPASFYAYYRHRASIWGLDASSDQAIAGAVMALEQAIVMGIALAYLFVRALEESEREQQRAERLEDHAAAL